MTTAGPNGITSAENYASIGSVAWTSPSNATADDGTFATFDAESSGDSQGLDLKGCGFSIPIGSTGISFTWEIKVKERVGADNIFEKGVWFLKAGTAVSSDVKSGTELPSTAAYRSFLSSSDTNGTSWSASDINNSGFGLRYQLAESVGNNTNATGSADHARCTVTYTAPAGGMFTQTACVGIGCTGPKNFVRGNE